MPEHEAIIADMSGHVEWFSRHRVARRHVVLPVRQGRTAQGPV
ncbi:hypothetical protein [Streptomyces fagopyri]